MSNRPDNHARVMNLFDVGTGFRENRSLPWIVFVCIGSPLGRLHTALLFSSVCSLPRTTKPLPALTDRGFYILSFRLHHIESPAVTAGIYVFRCTNLPDSYVDVNPFALFSRSVFCIQKETFLSFFNLTTRQICHIVV